MKAFAANQRYSRQLALPQLGEQGQSRLAGSCVAVIGAGGLGSPVITYLAAAGVGSLIIIDGDTVDISNLNRQTLYAERDIGKSKAVAAAAMAAQLNSDISIIAVSEMLNEDNAERLLSGCDAAVDCVDNREARKIAGRAALALNIPLVEGGADGFTGFVMTVKRGEACFGCVPSGINPTGETAVLGAAAGVAGAIMAAECVKLLTDIGQPIFSKLLAFDLETAQFQTIELVRDERCALCS